MFSFQDLFEPSHRLFHGNIFSGNPCKLLGHMEGLGTEPLDLAGPRDGELVLFTQFLDPEDRDNILQFLVPLKGRLNAPGDPVMFFTHGSAGELITPMSAEFAEEEETFTIIE